MVPAEQAGGHQAGGAAARSAAPLSSPSAQGGRGEEAASQERDQDLCRALQAAAGMVSGWGGRRRGNTHDYAI